MNEEKCHHSPSFIVEAGDEIDDDTLNSLVERLKSLESVNQELRQERDDARSETDAFDATKVLLASAHRKISNLDEEIRRDEAEMEHLKRKNELMEQEMQAGVESGEAAEATTLKELNDSESQKAAHKQLLCRIRALETELMAAKQAETAAKSAGEKATAALDEKVKSLKSLESKQKRQEALLTACEEQLKEMAEALTTQKGYQAVNEALIEQEEEICRLERENCALKSKIEEMNAQESSKIAAQRKLLQLKDEEIQALAGRLADAHITEMDDSSSTLEKRLLLRKISLLEAKLISRGSK